MNEQRWIEGRPDFGNPTFGQTTIRKHPKYVYSISRHAMLVHKVSYVTACWYKPYMDRLLRLETPKLIATAVCGQGFFIHLPDEKRKFRASLCEIPRPDAVLCLSRGATAIWKAREATVQQRDCQGQVRVLNEGEAMTGHFAYPNTGIICGTCSSMMFPDYRGQLAVIREDFKYIVYCPNKKCPHYEIRYRVPRAAAFQLERVDE